MVTVQFSIAREKVDEKRRKPSSSFWCVLVVCWSAEAWDVTVLLTSWRIAHASAFSSLLFVQQAVPGTV